MNDLFGLSMNYIMIGLLVVLGVALSSVGWVALRNRVLFFIGALLFVISFSLNAVAEFFVRNRLMKRFKGI